MTITAATGSISVGIRANPNGTMRSRGAEKRRLSRSGTCNTAKEMFPMINRRHRKMGNGRAARRSRSAAISTASSARHLPGFRRANLQTYQAAAAWCRLYHIRKIVPKPGAVATVQYLHKLHRQHHVSRLTDEYMRLEHKLKLGGGPDKIAKIHSQGKLTARERIDLLLDPDTFSARDRPARRL